MKRSIALAAILVLGGLPVGADAVAHLASNAAAYPAPAQVAPALTAGTQDAWGLPGPAAKMAAPTLSAICGMSVNNPWPPPTAGLGPVDTGNMLTVKLAQCYFSDPGQPLHRTTPRINGLPGSLTTPANGQRMVQRPARLTG
jgi:hypothetical protein